MNRWMYGSYRVAAIFTTIGIAINRAAGGVRDARTMT